MADVNVADRADLFGYEDAMGAIRQTSQAIAILRAVTLAVAAQEDGSVTYEERDIGASRWAGAVEAAEDRVRAIRDAIIDRVDAPAVNWCTPLNLLEATGASLWTRHYHRDRASMTSEELQDVCAAICTSLSELRAELTADAAGRERVGHEV